MRDGVLGGMGLAYDACRGKRGNRGNRGSHGSVRYKRRGSVRYKRRAMLFLQSVVLTMVLLVFGLSNAHCIGLWHQKELGFSDGLRYSGKMDVVDQPEPHEM